MATGAFDADVNVEMKQIIPFLSLPVSLTGSVENAFHIQAGFQSQTLPVNKSMGGMFSKRLGLISSARTCSDVGACGVEIHP